MKIDSIKDYYSGTDKLERLKRRSAGVYDRQFLESNVGNKASYEDKSGRVMDENNSAAFSFKGGKFYSSKGLGKLLQFIDEHNQIANASVAFIMAGVLRPTLTMGLNLKEKKDKFLPAIHSFSSAVLGLAVTVGVTQPVDAAIKKVMEKPDFYGNKKIAEIKKEIGVLKEKGYKSGSDEIKNLNKQLDTMKLISRNLPEWIICVPRAMLTVALVPAFMKLLTPIFTKMEDKHSAKKTANSPALAPAPVAETSEKDVNFKGKADAVKKSGLYDKFTDWIAKKVITPFMNTKLMQNKSWQWRDKEFLYDGMATVASFAISSTYAVRSYKNKKIDSDKNNRRILALNHFLTWAIATAVSLLTVKKLGIWWQRHPMAKLIENRLNVPDFAKKYAQRHQELLDDAQKITDKTKRKIALREARGYSAKDFYAEHINEKGVDKEMSDMLNGLGLFQKLLVWGTVTRLLVPLCSTVLASKYGRKAIAKREARQEAAQQAQQAQNIQMRTVENKELAETEKAAA